MAFRRDDIVEATKELLEPGDIDLVGLIVHTEYSSADEHEMTQATIDIGEAIADVVTDEGTYIYSGVDDPDFGMNQHQGLTLEGDEFVWECQQLLRDGTFDLVFYFERTEDMPAIVAMIEQRGFTVTKVDPTT